MAGTVTAKVESYRDLFVWQQAMELAVGIYNTTKYWPKEELYGLTSHVRRAAVSIPANIAEGYGRETRASYEHFLRVAQGSLKELETHLLLAERVGTVAAQRIAPMMEQCQSLGKMIRSLIRALQEKDKVD